MTFGFRDYLKAEVLTELLSSLFLGGKHPRIVSFCLLLLLGVFWILKGVFRLLFWVLRTLFHLLGWVSSGGMSRKLRHSLKSLKKTARKYQDRVSPIQTLEDIAHEKWWKFDVLLAGSENTFSFFVHTTTGELRASFHQVGFENIPIALAPYLLEIRRQSDQAVEKEGEVVAEVYGLLRAQYRPSLVFV